MRNAICNFCQQFAFEPRVINEEKLPPAERFIVAGMGGSHLAADLLKVWDPSIDIVVHSDYGLPAVREGDLEQYCVIASSYSGNTEETVDAFLRAKEKNLALAVVATGGKLLALAKQEGVPYIELPHTGIQPRSALGFSVKALLCLMKKKDALDEVGKLCFNLDSQEYEQSGRELALRLKGYVPVILSSNRNFPIAYNWKIKFNETGKIPAFCNMFPELNHNEMTGFDVATPTKSLSQNFYFIFLKDSVDDPRIVKRMEVMRALYDNRGLKSEMLELGGNGTFHKIFSSLILADWAAYHTAAQYGVEPEQVPMVEEFKRLIA